MGQAASASEHSSDIKLFSKFIIVGLSNFAVSFTAFYLLYNYGKLSALLYTLLGGAGKNLESSIVSLGADSLDAALANGAAYGIGVINSFVWNKNWTFKAKQEATVQLCRFLALNLSCLLLSSASLFFWTDYLQWPYQPVWFVTMGIVTLVNFAVSKYWVFRATEDLPA